MEQQNIGIAPLFVQVFHNNMTDGISEISFTYDAGNLCYGTAEYWNCAVVCAGIPQ